MSIFFLRNLTFAVNFLQNTAFPEYSFSNEKQIFSPSNVPRDLHESAKVISFLGSSLNAVVVFNAKRTA